MEQDFTVILNKHLRHLNGNDTLDWQRPLKEYGLDSVTAINLLFDLEDRFGVMFPDDMLNQQTFATATTLYDALKQVSN